MFPFKNHIRLDVDWTCCSQPSVSELGWTLRCIEEEEERAAEDLEAQEAPRGAELEAPQPAAQEAQDVPEGQVPDDMSAFVASIGWVDISTRNRFKFSHRPDAPDDRRHHLVIEPFSGFRGYAHFTKGVSVGLAPKSSKNRLCVVGLQL